MDSNTHSSPQLGRRPGGLATLAAAINELATQDLDGLNDVALAERVLTLRRLVDRLEGHWLKELAAVDARGAAGADQDQQAGSTAAWLRNRLRLGAGAAQSAVRTARALFCGPLTGTAAALANGELSVAHAAVVAHGTQDLPDRVTVEAEPVLVEAACRLDPPRLRRVLGHLRLVADPDGEHDCTHQRHARRGLWLAPTFEGMVAVDGLLEPEAGQTLLAALEPLVRPADANDSRSGSQRNADALTELARHALEGGWLPQTGGVRPQLTVTVDLDSLLGRHHAVGGEVGGWGPLDPEACQRLACDSSVTRVLVTRHPTPTTTTTPTVPVAPGAWRPGCGRRWPCCPGPRGCARPAAGGGPGQSGRPGRPAHRPGRSRRRLCVPRLHPAAGLVRGPSSTPLAPWRPDRSGQPGLAVPSPSSSGP